VAVSQQAATYGHHFPPVAHRNGAARTGRISQLCSWFQPADQPATASRPGVAEHQSHQTPGRPGSRGGGGLPDSASSPGHGHRTASGSSPEHAPVRDA
jgi:hypothetical protein